VQPGETIKVQANGMIIIRGSALKTGADMRISIDRFIRMVDENGYAALN
jgi:hypothetical protein